MSISSSDESSANSPIVPAEALRPLLARKDGPALAHLAGHLALLVAAGLFVAALRGTIWVWPAMFAEGVVLIFLFSAHHECIHRTAFRTRGLNDGLAFAIGLLLLLPREYFRAFHFAHHRYTQDPANDPELARPKPANIGEWMLNVSGLLYWWHQGKGLINHARGLTPEPYLRDSPMAAKVVWEARVALVIYAALLVASVASVDASLLWFWVLPVLLGQPVLRLFLLAEHTLCPLVPDMLKNSRTTRSNVGIRLLSWNMPYHAEHHAHPAVPFHALPHLHEILGPHLGCVAEGYVQANREILTALGR